MGPFSHIVIASKLAPHIKPDDLQQYYWGAVAPDTRYTARLKRRQTHIKTWQMMDFFHQYPHLKSFMQGYIVHCISDKIILGRLFFPTFPLSFFRRFIPNPLIVVLLELYYFEQEPVQEGIWAVQNEVLTALGLSEADSAKYAEFVNQYTASSPLEERLSILFQFFGLERNSNIERYKRAAERFQKNRLLKGTSFFGIRAARISEKITEKVLSWMPEGSVDG